MNDGPDSAPMPEVRKGQGDVNLSREEFVRRIGERFYDPAFDGVRNEVERIIDIAWNGYDQYRKSPRTRKAGAAFADPDFELPVEWLETRARILKAECLQRDISSPRRILLVCGAARHDQTLSRRNVQDLPSGAARTRGDRGKRRVRVRRPRSQHARSMGGRSPHARPVFRLRCRSVTGHVPATLTMRWDKRATG
jgi:hypothetical protein